MGSFKDSDYYKLGKLQENALQGSKKAIIKNKELKKNRERLYLENPKKCLECNEMIPYEKRMNKFCSSSCSVTHSNKNRQIDEATKNKISLSMTGKIKSEETKNKISKGNVLRFSKQDERDKISQTLINYYKDNIEAKKNISKQLKGRKVSDEMKSKLSEIMSNKIKDGLFKPKLKSIKCNYPFKDKKIRCDSKVEYSCLDYFEKNYTVIDIERCNFLIDFEFNNVLRKYNPDFKITTENVIYIVECKTILSNKELVRKWKYYYDTIEQKKDSLQKYCNNMGYIAFNYDKKLNDNFYKKLKF
jgi:hypothetical protein